ncbi:hypothetical protein DFQ27_008132, partial [Actinomortierella ambigua]
SGVEDFSDDEHDDYRHRRSHRLHYHPQGYSFFKSHHHHHSQSHSHSRSSSSSSSTRSGPGLEIGVLQSQPYREDDDNDDNDDDDNDDHAGHEEEEEEEEEVTEEEGGDGRRRAKWPSQCTNGPAAYRHSPQHSSRKPIPFQSFQGGSNSQEDRRNNRGRRADDQVKGDMGASGEDEEYDEDDEDDREQDRLLGRATRKARVAGRGGSGSGVGGRQPPSSRSATGAHVGTLSTIRSNGKENGSNNNNSNINSNDNDNGRNGRPATPPARPYRLFSFGSLSKRSDNPPSQGPQAKTNQRRRSGWLEGDPSNELGEADAEEVLDVDALIAEQERIARELAAQEEALQHQEEAAILEKRRAAIKVAERRGLLRLESDPLWISNTNSSNSRIFEKQGALAPLEEQQLENRSNPPSEITTISTASSYVGGEDALNQELKMMDLAIKNNSNSSNNNNNNNNNNMEQSEGLSMANGKVGHTSGRDHLIPLTTTLPVVLTQAATNSPNTKTMHLALKGGNDCSSVSSISSGDHTRAEPTLMVSSSTTASSPSSAGPASPLFSMEPKRTRTVSSVSTSTTTSSSHHPTIDPREMLSHLTTSILKRVDGAITGGGSGHKNGDNSDNGSGNDTNNSDDDVGGSLSDQETALSRKKKRKSAEKRTNTAFSQTALDTAGSARPSLLLLPGGFPPEASRTKGNNSMGFWAKEEKGEDDDDKAEEEDDTLSVLPPPSLSLSSSSSSPLSRTRTVSMDVPMRHHARPLQQTARERSRSGPVYEGGSWSSLLYTGASSLMGYFGGGGGGGTAETLRQQQHSDSEDDEEEDGEEGDDDEEDAEGEEDEEEKSISTTPLPSAAGTRAAAGVAAETEGGGGGGIGASLYASIMSRAKGLAPTVTRAASAGDLEEGEEEEYGEELDYNF